MKVISILLLIATLALATFAHVARSNENNNVINEISTTNVTSLGLDETYVQFFEAFKKVMPCGMAKYNIPPMAPYRSQLIKVNYSTEHLRLTGDIDNLSVFGLEDFLILQLNTDTSTNRTKSDILHRNVQILGKINVTMEANLAGFKIVQPLEGFLNIQIINMRVATAMNVGQNEVGGIQVSDLDYTLQVGDIVVYNLNIDWSVAVNSFVNQYIGDFSKIFLETYREPLGKLYAKYSMLFINQVLNNVTYSSLSSALNESIQLFKSLDCKK